MVLLRHRVGRLQLVRSGWVVAAVDAKETNFNDFDIWNARFSHDDVAEEVECASRLSHESADAPR